MKPPLWKAVVWKIEDDVSSMASWQREINDMYAEASQRGSETVADMSALRHAGEMRARCSRDIRRLTELLAGAGLGNDLENVKSALQQIVEMCPDMGDSFNSLINSLS